MKVKDESILNVILVQLKNKYQYIKLLNTDAIRDYIFIEDLAKLIKKIIKSQYLGSIMLAQEMGLVLKKL